MNVKPLITLKYIVENIEHSASFKDEDIIRVQIDLPREAWTSNLSDLEPDFSEKILEIAEEAVKEFMEEEHDNPALNEFLADQVYDQLNFNADWDWNTAHSYIALNYYCD